VCVCVCVCVQVDVMSVFDSIFKKPCDVINLFYQYDNDARSWNIYERCVCVCDVCVCVCVCLYMFVCMYVFVYTPHVGSYRSKTKVVRQIQDLASSRRILGCGERCFDPPPY